MMFYELVGLIFWGRRDLFLKNVFIKRAQSFLSFI